MATLPGTYVRTGLSAIPRVNAIVDVLLAGSLVEFRQITIYHEVGNDVGNGWFKLTYNNWNPDFPTEVYFNKKPEPLSAGVTLDPIMGRVRVLPYTPGDNVTVSYNFDYFPIYALEGFVMKAVDFLNVAPNSAPTEYTIADAPSNWDGVISDLVAANCMEKLILDYDLWKGRLIFAIGPQQALEGGGDVVSQLTTLKQNFEERAYKVLENNKFKNPDALAPPTNIYYDSLITGSVNRGTHSLSGMGKMRGWHQNKYAGTALV